jgi:hypothetical protein
MAHLEKDRLQEISVVADLLTQGDADTFLKWQTAMRLRTDEEITRIVSALILHLLPAAARDKIVSNVPRESVDLM